MLFLAKAVWVYRNEIILGVQLLNALRRTARESAQTYIRNRMKQQMMRSVGAMLFQVSLLGGALLLVHAQPFLFSRLVASTVLWWITLYNLAILIWVTIPELRAVHKSLRSKRGYALKYFLQVSVVTEIMQGSALWLTLCLGLGWSSRTFIGSQISYWKPWAELWFGI